MKTNGRNTKTNRISKSNDVIYLKNVWYIPLIYMVLVYVRFQDFVGSITVARRAGVLRHNCLIRTLDFHFETPRKFGRKSLKNEGGFSIEPWHRDGTPRDRWKAEVCYIRSIHVIY
jgi:hypothetical protein